MGKCLLNNDIFKSTMNRLSKYINTDLIKLFNDGSIWLKKEFSTIGICSIQIVLVNIFRSYNINPDLILGHSMGEIAAAYCDGAIDEETTINIAYIRNKLIKDSDIGPGKMVMIGLLEDNINNYITELSINKTRIACYNSLSGQVVSGPINEVELLINHINEKNDNVFIREIFPPDRF